MIGETLNFSEACAAHRAGRKVQISIPTTSGGWSEFGDWMPGAGGSVACSWEVVRDAWSVARFRIRPVRSRVQDMAAAAAREKVGHDLGNALIEAEYAEHYEQAFRAACEFLRDRAHTDDVCREPDHWAMRIEAHFLEPR